MIDITPAFRPKLDPDFIPAALWNQAYLRLADATKDSLPVRISIERPDGTCWTYDTKILPDTPKNADATWLYCERLVKLLLWAWGGARLRIAGAPHIVTKLQQVYSATGTRAFDFEFIGQSCFNRPFQVENATFEDLKPGLPALLLTSFSDFFNRDYALEIVMRIKRSIKSEVLARFFDAGAVTLTSMKKKRESLLV